MHLFADDSDTFAKNGFICLAGFIASDMAWDSFSERWVDLLEKHGLPVMHTSDFLSGQGEYRNFDLSYDERLDILREFMDVIREEIQCGIFCAINASEYRSILSEAKKKLKPEEFLFRRILSKSFEYMRDIKSIESISFWFDDSNMTSTRFLSIYASTKKSWKAASTMLASIAFGDDKTLPPLQAADVLANVLVRAHASGVEAWHGQSPFNRLFIDPKTNAISNHIKGEIWEPKDVARLRSAIVDMARTQ